MNINAMCSPESHLEHPSTPSKPTSLNGTLTPTRSTPPNNNNLGNLLSAKLDTLPKAAQFLTLALCVFFFFGIHNVLQEAMINTDGFQFGVMLGWMEVLGVTLCSGIERSSLPYLGNGENKRGRSAPLMAYPPLTVCLVLSSSLASWSLNYINFPTKVVFRSCKLLPTMIIAVVMGNAKRFTFVEVGSALSVCAGLIIFAAGDWNLSKPQFHPFGLALVTSSVFADAVLPNAQEKLFRTYDASKSEVMFYTNVFTFIIQTGSAVLSGDLMGMFHFVMGRNGHVDQKNSLLASFWGSNSTANKEILLSDADIENNSPGQIRYTFLTYVLFYILISHIAVSAHTAVVKKFGGVAAVFVGTARKGMTLVLSVSQSSCSCAWVFAI
jgi:adenosine 3'-phospho 5'-phosphosulfate transporter B3